MTLPRLMAAAALAFGLALPAIAAYPAKVIRDVFPVAETGFDPQAVATTT